MAPLLKPIYYELRTINLYLEGRHLVLALFASKILAKSIYNNIKEKKMSEYITDDREISDDSDEENSDEEISNKEN